MLLGLFSCGGPAPPAQPAPVATRALPAPEVDCGIDPYVAHPAWSGPKPVLPAPPVLSGAPKKAGDAYTVFGAINQLHMDPAPLAKDIVIVGVIVDTNLVRAPACALHRTGKADPAGCVTEIPAFRIADGAGEKQSIAVMGWASNFSNVFEASVTQPWVDTNWAVRVPAPLPAVGAKVKVTGRYGMSFTKSSTGISTDPRNGIMTFGAIEVLEPAPQPVKLPIKVP